MTTWCGRVTCARLCEEGGYTDVEPALVADGLSALTDGLWLDLLVRPDSMSRERARRITLSYLADVFPRHFSQPPAEGKA
jgi:TetR/AcrR family transcriptional repressor of bet genes